MKNIYKSIELKNEIEKIENFKLNDEESKLIVGYMEGHDYIIKSDGENLYVVDIQDEEYIIKESLKDIVNRVLEWNESLKEDIQSDMNSLHLTLDENIELKKLEKKLLSLEEDEKVLSNLFEILNRKPMTEKENNDISETVKKILKNEIDMEQIENIIIEKIKVIGSRQSGRYRENSDLDILVEYKEDIKEYKVFNMLNGLELEYDGLKVDFIPDFVQ